MKFAFISTMDSAPWGGSEELWGQSAVQLKRAGHEVQASVAPWSGRSEKVRELVQQGIQVESRPSKPISWFRKTARTLARKGARGYERLRQFHPDLVIISQGFNAGGFDWAKVCAEARIPYVVIVHCNSELWWYVDSTVLDAVATYTHARKVFCVSHSNLDLLRLQVGEPLRNAEVVWNPYGVSPECATAWPSDESVWRLACIARLDPAAKGQDLLLRILSSPQWRERPVELKIFGSGSYESNLRRMAETMDLKSVSFPGYVSNIEKIWKEHHLLVLPSRYEGLPLALVEAMWCGRPVVATDVGGNAELCVDEETGFIASAATISSFGETLERAWQRRSDWQNMGKAARARAEALIPKNPIAVFCEKLKSCVEAGPEIVTTGDMTYANR
jgi:glycosyltransferase involved in cell wall biosynthesis